jgi:hypothetical protein
MMTGAGPFGAIGMGGMFSVVKVRREQKPGDYTDPGWFKHPPGTVASEFKGQLASPTRAPQAASSASAATAPREVEVTVRKPVHHKH